MNKQALFIQACSNGDDALVRGLINDPNISPNVANGWLLRDACSKGNYDIVEILLEDGRIPFHRSMFTNACGSGKVKLVEKLLKIVIPTVDDINEVTNLEIYKLFLRDPLFHCPLDYTFCVEDQELHDLYIENLYRVDGFYYTNGLLD